MPQTDSYRKVRTACRLAANLIPAFCDSAFADEPGSVAVTVGWVSYNPHGRSGSLHVTEAGGRPLDLEQPGSGVSVSKTQTAVATVAYALSSSVWVQAVAGLPVDQQLRGTGTLEGSGVIGKGQQLSPTLLVKYDFDPFDGRLHPFLSGGVSHTTYRKLRIVNDAFRQATYGPGSSASASASSSFNLAANVGVDYRIDPHWFLNGVLVYAPVRTGITVRAENTPLGVIVTTTHVRLKTVAPSVNLGYTF